MEYCEYVSNKQWSFLGIVHSILLGGIQQTIPVIIHVLVLHCTFTCVRVYNVLHRVNTIYVCAVWRISGWGLYKLGREYISYNPFTCIMQNTRYMSTPSYDMTHVAYQEIVWSLQYENLYVKS